MALLVASALTLSAQNAFYVSPTGDDARSGDKSAPFRSIERGLRAARNAKGETIVYLREGVYRLQRPIVFTSADGGASKPLTVKAYGNETVVLTGGVTLKTAKWQPYRDGVMRTRLHGAPETIDRLFVNGALRSLARFPNYDSTAVRFNGTSADATSPERVKRWKRPEGGFVHAMHVSDWGDFHYRITGKDDAGNLKLEGGWQNNRRSGLHKHNRMVEGVFEELDAPGEWFFDRASGYLYYMPLAGERLSDAGFETPVLKHLVEFRGTDSQPVSHIRLQGLKLTQTARTFMEKYEPLLRSDWMIYRGGAVLLEGTEDCSIGDCDLYDLGGNAVFFSGYNRRATVRGSHFSRIGASAVCFVGNADAVRSPSFEYGQYVNPVDLDRTIGPKSENYPAHCSVEDNLIHNIGLCEKQITGVELSMSSHITVSHNTIYDTPRAGINVSEGTWGGHVIEHNDVFDTVKETGDHGAFNSWGRDRFWHPNRSVMDSLTAADPQVILLDACSPTTLRHNRFRCDRGWDIDLDDGSSNYRIYDNLCLNGGIKLREGFYRIVENNIMINNSFHPHVWFGRSGDVFTRNLVMTPYRPIQVSRWGTEIDYNIFTDSVALKDARAKGLDAHSVVCTPKFHNPTVGNYRIDNDQTEVFLTGFRNFDMDDFGVLSPRLKLLARKPVFPIPAYQSESDVEKVVSWLGCNLKSLTTLSERSATGMDTERGVYVVSVDALNSPLRDYFKPNDVILKWDGNRIDNLQDLLKATRTKSNKAHKVIVFRMQKAQTVTIPAEAI